MTKKKESKEKRVGGVSQVRKGPYSSQELRWWLAGSNTEEWEEREVNQSILDDSKWPQGGRTKGAEDQGGEQGHDQTPRLLKRRTSKRVSKKKGPRYTPGRRAKRTGRPVPLGGRQAAAQAQRQEPIARKKGAGQVEGNIWTSRCRL